MARKPSLRARMTMPTANSGTVCPSPQDAPTHTLRQMLPRLPLTMVATATTWSASVACLRPSRKPSASAAQAPDPISIKENSPV